MLWLRLHLHSRIKTGSWFQLGQCANIIPTATVTTNTSGNVVKFVLWCSPKSTSFCILLLIFFCASKMEVGQMCQLLLWGMHTNIDFNAEKNPWAGVSCVIQEEERGQLATNFVLPLFLQELNQFSCLNGVAEKHNHFKNYFPPLQIPQSKQVPHISHWKNSFRKSMDWNSPSQQRSKDFYLMNITHIKIRFF